MKDPVFYVPTVQASELLDIQLETSRAANPGGYQRPKATHLRLRGLDSQERRRWRRAKAGFLKP